MITLRDMSMAQKIKCRDNFPSPTLSAIVLSFLLPFCYSAESQIINTLPYEFSYGISGGTAFSRVSFNPRIVQVYSTGITCGLTGRMTMGENVGLQLEINYARQGWKEDFSETETPDYKYCRRLNYIQVPFYTHVQFGGKNVKGFINAGPQLGYFLNESTSDNLNGATPGRVNYQHDMPVENRFEWGISGGPGIEIRTRAGYFLIEGRYFYSFGDIYGTQRKDNFAKASTQTMIAKITYLLPLKH
jgi:hypothetical protein